jgi:meso-butanediol dehydrogenase / (S,S)-butanediol dehydrogenase / diacetyl reductase
VELGLEGRTAIVTGGSSGIGAAIVQGLVREKANVVIADVDPGAAERLATSLPGNGVIVCAMSVDVTQKSSVQSLVAAVISKFGTVEILVNNAGIAQDKLFVDIEEEDWDRVNAVNAKGAFLMAKAVAPHMMAARYGKIVNISSRSGKEGQIGLSHYAASKFAVIGFTQALAKEMAAYNINVNAVCPGIVRTAMWEKLLSSRAERQDLPRERLFDSWIKQVPLARPQEPEDVANVVLFLSSDVSRNMTGEAVNVNGGLRMD